VGAEGEAEENRGDAFRRLASELERTYPDQEAVLKNYRQVAERLLAYVEEHPEADDAGQARVLAAEVLILGGEPRAARELWAALVNEGPRDADRARGLYLLGEHYFLRADRLRSHRQHARRYFGVLAERYPDSSWAKAARRPLRFLALLEEETLPRFEAAFRARRGDESEGEESIHDDTSLRGKLAVLDFWRAGAQDQREFEMRLGSTLDAALAREPGLRARVAILGINLDEDGSLFEAARKEWDIHWPQHHDGKGFATELIDVFGIPRAPYALLIGPDGKLLFAAGADERLEFLRRFQGALEALARQVRQEG
jgi:hypothetical protein